MKSLLTFLPLIGLLSACAQKPGMPDTLPFQVAKAYGIENFDKVNSIAYTWNVQRDSVTVFSRKWKWNVKDSTVYYSGADTTLTYSLNDDALPEVDQGFINDKYWLMFPFQLAWDSGYTYEVADNVTSPLKGTPSTKLTIIYTSGEPKSDGMGYTPGDAYDLYLDKNHKILEWTHRRGNAPEGRSMTWENEENFGPISFATSHLNMEGKRSLWFSDIKVE
jgi:hypothetical protein